MKRTRIYAYVKPHMKAHLDFVAAALEESTSSIVEQALIALIGDDKQGFLRKRVRYPTDAELETARERLLQFKISHDLR